MLNIFYGRENIDKEKFLYERVGQSPERALILVPDQYTLEAEKQAFRYLGVAGLMDVEIISMSRLGFRLLSEQGGGKKTFIDKYGRHMLLSKILSKNEDSLQVFKNVQKKNAFIEMTNNFISEIKQYNVSPQELEELAEGLPEDSLLRRKLTDLHLIFSRYEEEIKGKYTDSEDYIDLYRSKITASQMIAESHIYVFGFDSFAPKALDVLGTLMESAREVNVLLTYDENCRDEEIFSLTGLVIYNLRKQAEARGVSVSQLAIPQNCAALRSPAVSKLEQELFTPIPRKSQDCRGITVVKAANMYSEAESAAEFILQLIREEGFRYRDIVVICNDQKVRGSIISRVFEECGIDLFDDKKRSILSSPIAIFVVSLLETVAGRYRTTDLFKVLKSGFTVLSEEEVEELENYALKYRIRGTMWKNSFVKGQLEYGDDGLERLEQIRQAVIAPFDALEVLFSRQETTGSFIEKYYDFLMEEAGLGEKILTLIKEQEAQGLLDLAEETSQIWSQIVGLFDQIAELSGEEPLVRADFITMLTTGLSELEVGVLPPTADDILMGTMQRTRSGPVRAVVVIGANEGVLPLTSNEEGLFSLEELDFLAAAGREICKVDAVRVLEEKLATYRNLSKAEDYLWVSYSTGDEEGKEIRPSEIIERILSIFPGLKVTPDVNSSGKLMPLIGGRLSTLRHLSDALQRAKKGEEIEGIWKAATDWFEEHDRQELYKVYQGLAFTNGQKNLPQELLQSLYIKEGSRQLVLSPSRLERFSRCPFSHFVAYGLRPSERRIFQASGREIGDIYHRCLMELSKKLTEEESWHTISEEECRSVISQVVARETGNYREGLFHFSNEEKYKASRIEDTCFHVCWALISQVRAGSIKESRYEEAFGRGREIDPIEVRSGDRTIFIEGKIDRLDILSDDRVKIIDYKTGKENFDISEARGGYRLQLMLYLKAAQENTKKPAGVFYFLISEPRVDLTGIENEKISEKISKEMKKSFRLNGIMIDDEAVTRDIAGEFSGFSDIVPLRNSKEGIKATSDGFLLSEEEFSQLQTAIDMQIDKLCSQLADGKISITPKKTEKASPCTYCDYKGICRFDINFSGCNYELIK